LTIRVPVITAERGIAMTSRLAVCMEKWVLEKIGFRRRKALIYLKRSKIGPRLLLRTN